MHFTQHSSMIMGTIMIKIIQLSSVDFYYKSVHNQMITGLVRVIENVESPGILLRHFPGLESPGKRPLVLESSGNLLNSTKRYEVYGRQ